MVDKYISVVVYENYYRHLNKNVGESMYQRNKTIIGTSNYNTLYQNKNSIFTQLLFNLPIILNIIAIALHIFGFLVLSLSRNKRNQDIIIMNLSISEIGMSSLDIMQNIVVRYKSLNYIAPYVTIVTGCLFVIPFLCILLILTVDRFLEVYLNIKYSIYCSKTKTIVLLILCWFVALCAGTSLVTLTIMQLISIDVATFKITYPVYEGILFVTASIIYGYIYKKYKCNKQREISLGKIRSTIRKEEKKRSKVSQWVDFTKTVLKCKKIRPTNNNTKTNQTKKSAVVVRKKNFFVPFLILLSLVLFVMLPDYLNLYLYYENRKKSTIKNEIWTHVLLCLYSLGFIIDALIYIFLQGHVRRLVIQKLFKKKKRRTLRDTIKSTNMELSSSTFSHCDDGNQTK